MDHLTKLILFHTGLTEQELQCKLYGKREFTKEEVKRILDLLYFLHGRD